MHYKLAQALDRCIFRIRRGDSIEQCLSEYPEIKDELGQLLRTFISIADSPKVVPSEDFRRQSKDRVMAQIRQQEKLGRDDTEAAGHQQSFLRNILSPRMITLPITALVIFIIVSILFTDFFGLRSTSPALAQPCTLSTLSGSVVLQETGTDTWIPGNDGTILDIGSSVKTGSASHALLTFFDGSTIKLEPESEIKIKKINLNKQQDTDIIVRQLSGTTWSHVSGPPESSMNFRVETPSAEIVVQGTSFSIEIEKSGSTRVAATEGSVTVSAQQQEIRLAANQQTIINAGSAPAAPIQRDEISNKFTIKVDLPSVASVLDPNGASTGCFPDGVSFNQITDSLSELLPDGSQVISIPQPVNGTYTLVIRNVKEQVAGLSIRVVSEEGLIFEHEDGIGGTGDSDRIIHIDIDVEAGKITGAEITDIKALMNRTPEKVVITDLAAERAISIKNALAEAEKREIDSIGDTTTERPVGIRENNNPDMRDNTRDIQTEEESPDKTRAVINEDDKPDLKDNTSNDVLSNRDTTDTEESGENTDSEDSIEADATTGTDNTTGIDDQTRDNDLTEEEQHDSTGGRETGTTESNDNTSQSNR